ncbi:CG31908 [Drosophila busckii]|uniref:SUZ RNA-binding domain-containing n=1 Tax=Drosophila busckii TaxID=30019 RepID=A0A0M4DZK4_DROBS|nr:CG31908 [Drosophila busckii]
MSNGDDVLDNWEEIDEAGLCMTLQTKLQTDVKDETDNSKCTTIIEPESVTGKMKLLQRPQSLQENGPAASPKQLMIAKKPDNDDDATSAAPVMMVLHKSASEYDAATYATPINNQTVKILRRPAQSEERRDSNGMRPKQPIKTLQQREQEYAEARLRILGSAKNPEDDKPPAPTAPASNSTTPAPAAPLISAASNNNVNNKNNHNANGPTSGQGQGPGMHRSSSAPKMSQTAPMYNNYNNYYPAPPTPAAMGYFYQQQQQQQQQQQMPPAHYNPRLPQYVPAPPNANPQQSWSPVVGGSVSAALLRQQSLQTPQQQQHPQQQHLLPHPQQQQQYGLPYNDSILRLPRGPCPNGTIGFQMRR